MVAERRNTLLTNHWHVFRDGLYR